MVSDSVAPNLLFLFLLAEVPNFINATLPPQERITAQEIDSYFRQELIYKRNERMGKRVKALLDEFPDKGFFFAFGAGEWLVTSAGRLGSAAPPTKGRDRGGGLPVGGEMGGPFFDLFHLRNVSS